MACQITGIVDFDFTRYLELELGAMAPAGHGGAMTRRLRLVLEPDAGQSVRNYLDERLNAHNIAATGISAYCDLAILLKDDGDEILGGLLAETWGDWLHIKVLWVAEEVRAVGHGRQMMAMAERYAAERGYRNAYLSTFSFQARPFYEKLGYKVFSVLEDFPPGHAKYYMRKRLENASSR
jgi:ribosomal protein S18 acetylase RimI-like enzyme